MPGKPRLAARWREVLDLSAKSGFWTKLGWVRRRRETRRGSLRWIARRRRVEGSILRAALETGVDVGAGEMDYILVESLLPA